MNSSAPLPKASSSFARNWLTCGLPYFLGPEEQRRRLLVELPANSDRTLLNFRVQPKDNFYTDAIVLVLYRLTEERELEYVNPEGTYAPVFLEFYDGPARRMWQTEPIHWANLAGQAYAPHFLFVPNIMAGGSTYSCRVTNYDDDYNYAIGVYFIGRLLRTTGPRGGAPIQPPTQYMASLIEAQRAKGQGQHTLRPDNEFNLEYVGISAALGVSDQPLDLPTGTYDAPVRRTDHIRTNAEWDFFLRYQRARVLPEYPLQVGDASLPSLYIKWPVFLELRDERFQFSLSNVPVAMPCCCGWAGQPFVFPVDWVWERSADIALNLWSSTSEAGEISLMWEGWNRKP